MDANQKFLKKLDSKRKQAILLVLQQIEQKDFSDIKKLKGFKDKYRARKGKIRVQFFIHDNGGVEILDTDFRNDNSY